MRRENLIICPVYNEEDTIREFYQDLRGYYYQDVLFVDDGSTDKSKVYLSEIKNKNTFIVRHLKRFGYGVALASGFKFALEKKYKRIVTIDVDLQHNPQCIGLFLRALIEYEVVLGSRYIRIDNYLNIPRDRLLINRYVSRLLKLLFSVHFTDPFCGYRGYRESFLRRICIKEKSYGLGLEIILEIIRLKSTFTEVPIEAIYFNKMRKFLDGLNNPRRRLLYYLEIVAKKRREIEDEKEIFVCESTS
jgi:glycosyltransferase involved in cell wall biosynthesis